MLLSSENEVKLDAQEGLMLEELIDCIISLTYRYSSSEPSRVSKEVLNVYIDLLTEGRGDGWTEKLYAKLVELVSVFDAMNTDDNKVACLFYKITSNLDCLICDVVFDGELNVEVLEKINNLIELK